MSLIRKPAAAEQESRFRQAAEEAIASGRMIRDVGRDAGRSVGRGLSKMIGLWLLVAFTFGAVTASQTGANVMGLMIMAPFWYLGWRRWSAPRQHH